MDFQYIFALLKTTLWTVVVADPSTVVYIAVILPNNTTYPFSIMHVRPAIDVTVTKLQHRGIFTKNTIKLLYADSKCSSTYGPIEAFRYSKIVQVFFGPVCDYSLAAVARYSAVWKIPVVSAGGLSHDFGMDKRAPHAEYRTLTRVGLTSFTSMAQVTTKVVQVYNWVKVLIVYEVSGFPQIQDKFCYLAVSALVYISKEDTNVKRPFEFVMFDPNKHNLASLLVEKVGLNYGGK
ncbi:hypothetical protein BsWGS_29167 [Bradybaena similaris]